MLQKHDLMRQQEVVAITGLTPRQVQYYTETGIGNPIKTGIGRGSTRLWRRTDIFDLMIAKELWSFGCTIGTIERIVPLIDQSVGKNFIFIRRHKETFRILPYHLMNEDSFISINLAKIRMKMRKIQTHTIEHK